MPNWLKILLTVAGGFAGGAGASDVIDPHASSIAAALMGVVTAVASLITLFVKSPRTPPCPPAAPPPAAPPK